MASEMCRILGVDPGSRHTGFGVVMKEGTRLVHVTSGTLTPPPRLPLELRLRFIHAGLVACIEEHRPPAVAVEDLFHAVNVRAALTLAHVRGAVLLAAASSGVAVASYPPAEVKKTVASTGAASKSQVAWMVERLIEAVPPITSYDTSDALAVAICHAHHLPVAAPAPRGGVGDGGRRRGHPATRS